MMDPEKMNAIIKVLLSLIPFVLIGGWLFYKDTKSKNSLFKTINSPRKKIRVGDKIYVVKTKTRILAMEKKTGKEAIVTTCGLEDGQETLDSELTSLPEGIKVRYRLKNGVFTAEESDWLAGEDFRFLEITQVEEYEQE
ncbi:MAG: hypothetical protein C0624_06945 [Desulfuromonas sp.]|nr:MAG: hypothetical protein C0624_06945 [Desulfuromonas sp.]